MFKKKELLSDLKEQEGQETTKPSLWTNLFEALVLILPIVIIVALILWSSTKIGASISENNTPYPSIEISKITIVFDITNKTAPDLYKTLIEIYIGIIGIVFGLLIFLAGGLCGKERNQMYALFKHSFIYYLLCLTLLMPCIFIIANFFSWEVTTVSQFVSLSIVIANIFAIILSTYRVIKCLIDKQYYNGVIRDFFNALFYNAVQLQTNKKIKENHFNTILEKIGIKYNPKRRIDEKHFHYFKSEKEGFITAINYKRLKKIIDLIDDNIKNGSKQEKVECFVLVRLFQKIKENQDLICITKNLINEKNCVAIKHLIHKTFSFNKIYNAPLKEIKEIIHDFANHIIQMTASRNLEEVRNLSNKLCEIISIYLSRENLCEDHGIKLYESSSFLEPYFSNLITSQFLDIFRECLETKSETFTNAVLMIPLKASNLSVQHNNPYEFNNFVRIFEIIYASTTESENFETSKKDRMINRIRLQLAELCSYTVVPKIEETQDEKKDKIIKNYVIPICYVFQNLLKGTFDYNDLKNFHLFKNTFIENIFKDIERDNDLNQSKEIELLKTSLYFAVESWILNKFIQQRNDKEKLDSNRKFYQEITKVPDENEQQKTILDDDHFKKLTEIFLQSRSIEGGNMIWWDHAEIMDGRRICSWYGSPTIDKLDLSYLINAIIILIKYPEIDLNKIYLGNLEELAGFSEYLERELKRELNGIINAENKSKWSFIKSELFGDKEWEKARDKLFAWFDILRKESEEQRRAKIREANINQNSVLKFKQAVASSFKQFVALRKIFIYYKQFEDKHEKISTNKNVLTIGAERYSNNKSTFINEDGYYASTMGERYGCHLGELENKKLLEKIDNSLNHKKDLDEFILEQELSKIENPIIIVCPNIYNTFLSKSVKYKAHWFDSVPQITEVADHKKGNKENGDKFCLEGVYSFEINGQTKHVPVFNISGGYFSRVFILDKNSMGKLIQYSPCKSDEEKQARGNDLKDIFCISIRETEKIELTSDDKSWLNSNYQTEEARQNYLKEHVFIEIIEKIDLDLTDIKGVVFDTSE